MHNKINTSLLTLLLFVCVSLATTLTGRVVSIADGDTFTMLVAGNRQVKIRLHGIDCPEKAQPWGSRAKEFTSEAVFGKEISVIVIDTDKYGRTIGRVMLDDGTCLNEKLVGAGLAWWYRQYAPNDQTLRELEATVRASNWGLWSDKDPIAPWEWRKGNKGSGSIRSSASAGQGNTECKFWLNTKSNVRHNEGCKYHMNTSGGKCVSSDEGKPCGLCGG